MIQEQEKEQKDSSRRIETKKNPSTDCNMQDWNQITKNLRQKK